MWRMWVQISGQAIFFLFPSYYHSNLNLALIIYKCVDCSLGHGRIKGFIRHSGTIMLVDHRLRSTPDGGWSGMGNSFYQGLGYKCLMGCLSSAAQPSVVQVNLLVQSMSLDTFFLTLNLYRLVATGYKCIHIPRLIPSTHYVSFSLFLNTSFVCIYMY